MALLVSDTFTEGSDVDLAAHTPDTGTGWTQEENTTSSPVVDIIVVGAEDEASPESIFGDRRILMSAQPDPTEADVDVQFKIGRFNTLSTGQDDAYGAFARFADTSNYYAIVLYNNTPSPNAYIIKKVGGTVTDLGSTTITIADTDEILFELRGTALRLLQNTVERISVTDSDLTSAGKVGICVGNYRVSTDDISERSDFDNFSSTEFSSGTEHELSGAIAGTSTLAASMNVAYALSGTIPATSSITGSVHVTYALNGTIAAVSVLAANINVAYALAGTIVGASALVGDLVLDSEEDDGNPQWYIFLRRRRR